MTLTALPVLHRQPIKVIKATSVEYFLDQWITPDGKTVTAKPPVNLRGHHYGPTLQACILHQYYGCGDTQPQLLE